MQDRKFLRSQIENLTSNRSVPAFASPTPVAEGERTEELLITLGSFVAVSLLIQSKSQLKSNKRSSDFNLIFLSD